MSKDRDSSGGSGGHVGPIPHEQERGGSLDSSDPMVRGLFDFSRGEVACVLLNAVYGLDNRATHAFDSRDWFTAPTPNMRPIQAPLSQWHRVAAMSKAERQARWATKAGRSAGYGPRVAPQVPDAAPGRNHD